MGVTGMRLLVASALGLALLLGAGPTYASGNAYSSLQADWLWEVQDLLYKAARNSDRWEREQEQIEQYIKGIGDALQRAVVAEYWSDLPRAKAHLHSAVALLREGVHRGYFPPSDLQPVLALVQLYRDVIKI